ncbi:RimJ/RimL family protein N-acetyltransferase [Microbacterium endophyticum]|uniref:RimJ/RimL family protein N-acetyltransferase n=2 Tax=Microbacterium endophyticum TaxID=1526412 RepID=A0A7W4V4R1_9MICO|nr:RimJ/RimL family protein N-acetyltransferase [Microbacterium endophyticum]NIK35130.1 RimJ/RimL family protein N-acetyltransferase [Microbacterium endophyticum]
MASSDIDVMSALVGDPQVMRYYSAPKTREQAADWISWSRAHHAAYGFGLWISETVAGEFIGDCGLTWQEVNRAPQTEVGYHVRSELQGLGYATEAGAACLEFARDHTDADCVVGIIHPENRPSERAAEEIGMTLVGDDQGSSFLRRVSSVAVQCASSGAR